LLLFDSLLRLYNLYKASKGEGKSIPIYPPKS